MVHEKQIEEADINNKCNRSTYKYPVESCAAKIGKNASNQISCVHCRMVCGVRACVRVLCMAIGMRVLQLRLLDLLTQTNHFWPITQFTKK